MMTIILAIILGALFGFMLNRVGATNPQNIINMLRLKDLHLMKTILLAIGVGTLLTFTFAALGLLDVGHFSVKTSYWGVVVGGAILGVGFALSGFCPGTGLAALATGRKDALFFVLGGFVGAFLYMLAYSAVKETGLLEKLWGGKVTLAQISTKYPALIESVSGTTIGLAIGAVLVVVAIALPTERD